MKKSLFAVAAAILCSFLFSSAIAVEFSAPIPTVSAPDQRSGANSVSVPTNPTSVPATNFIFYGHPLGDGQNFTDAPVTITIDGTAHTIEGILDVFATPGFISNASPSPLPADPEMITDVVIGSYSGFSPWALKHNGFCPAPYTTTVGADTYTFIFECNVSIEIPDNRFNKFHRQIIVDDYRNFDASETLPIDPSSLLVATLIGDDEETKLPYSAVTHPATIKNAQPENDFRWKWWNSASNNWTSLGQPYTGIYAYAVTNTPEGIAIVNFDPVRVEKKIKVTKTRNSTFSAEKELRPILDEKPYKALTEHLGPIFFNKDTTSKTMKLTGYMTAPGNKMFDAMESETFDIADMVLKSGAWPQFLNFNPIDIKLLKGPITAAGRSEILAVVNYAAIFGLDACFRNERSHGWCVNFAAPPAEKIKTLRQLVGTKTADTTIEPIPVEAVPHNVISYVTLYRHVTDTAGSIDPNKVWEPYYAVPVGQGMFHSAVLSVGSPPAQRDYLVVASGEPAKDSDGNDKHYFYVIDPIATPENELYFDEDPENTRIPTPPVQKANMLMPKAYEVTPPADNLSLYGVWGGNFDGDGCDLAFTWRGRYVLPIKPAGAADTWHFMNREDPARELSYFSMSDTLGGSDQRFFSNYVTIIFGKPEGMTCKFYPPSDTTQKNIVFTALSPSYQIAAIAVGDIDGNHDYDDFIAADFVPKQIPEVTPTQYTAYGYPVYNPGSTTTATIADTSHPIRLGFTTTTETVPTDNAGVYNYFMTFFKENKGVTGASWLERDPYGNIGAVVGPPFVQPKFGCDLDYTDINKTDVVSFPSMAYAIRFDELSGKAFRDAAGKIVPMWCRDNEFEPRCEAPEGLEYCCTTDLAVLASGITPGTPTTAIPPNRHPCCDACDTIEETTRTYPILCRRLVGTLCPAPDSMLDNKKDKFFAENPKGDGGSKGGGTDFGFKFNLIREAQAGDPEEVSGFSSPGVYVSRGDTSFPYGLFRWPRGHLMGESEITLLLKQPPYCGNGDIDTATGETCDTARSPTGCPSGQTCNSSCTCEGIPTRCGDGHVDPGEGCDTGGGAANTCATDGATGSPMNCIECTCKGCGDRVRAGTEECDTTDIAYCSTLHGAGTYTCTSSCTCEKTAAGCHTGDGIIEPGFDCDVDTDCQKPNVDHPDWGPGWTCGADCMCHPPGETGPTCGNNVREGTEACDGTADAACPGRCIRPGEAGECTCPPPTTEELCGNGRVDDGEDCRDDGLPDVCENGMPCVNCHCLPGTPEIPGGEEPDPTDPCPPCTTGPCPCPCPCTPTPGSTCTMPATKDVVIKCGGAPSPALKDWMDQLNAEFRQIIRDQGGDPGQNDIACFPEFPMTIQIRQPNGDKAVFAQGMGSVPVDFTTKAERATKTLEMPYPQQTILLPLAIEGKAAVMPDLSASTLATAATISPDLVTNYQAAPAAAGAPAQYSYSLNNVVTMSTSTAPVSKQVEGVDHVTVTNISYVSQPLLCAMSASCPDSEALTDPKKGFADFSIEDIKTLLRQEGRKWVGGVNPEMGAFLENLTKAPTYEKTTFSVALGKTDGTLEDLRGGFIAIPPETVRSGAKAAGGCKCNMTALPPDMPSIIMMIVTATAAATGYVTVRKRAKRK